MTLTIPTKADLVLYRGDDGSITFAHDVTPANVAEARFFIRQREDGALVLSLTLTGQPAQWSIGVGTGTVSILAVDTAAAPAGDWVYDVELEDTSNVVTTVQRGRMQILADIASDGAGELPIRYSFGGFVAGMELSYVDAGTIQAAAGCAVLRGGGEYRIAAAANITFANLDTGVEAAGTTYYVYATADGFKLSMSASAPTGYTTDTSQLIGWFHNNPSSDILKWSVASGDNTGYPRRGPKPGMVGHPSGFMIDIYIASNSGGAGNGLHAGVNAAASAYNATPWASINAFNAMRACANAGKRLCTNEEWNQAALGTPAGADDNVTCWTASANTGSHPTGTLPNCKSHLGVYDMTGNVWEWVGTWYAETDVYTDQSGWAWATAWTNEAEGGSAYTPFGNNAGPDAYTGPRAWVRGGAWNNSTAAGGWAALGYYSPRYARSHLGLRCCASRSA